jgi:hypothetical protein
MEITIGMRVSLVTARHNTSIVTYSLPGGQPQTYVVPNIDFQAAQAGAPNLSSVDDTAADNTIDQVVSAPGGTTNYYVLTLPGKDAEGDPNMEIQATYDENASHIVLLKNQRALAIYSCRPTARPYISRPKLGRHRTLFIPSILLKKRFICGAW